MEDQYGMADLRQYVTGRPFFPAISPPPGLPSVHRDFASDNHPYYMLNFRSVSSTSTAPPGVTITTANTGGVFTAGFETECGGGAGRWPRQETLTLLEIRSGLDPKFKEANQKGPLWDEVSRIMYEEYGYQRSGKKCREKFENLYKYYKKTKVGKAGRQDGKHYRFFRQLEALYGDQTTNNNNNNNSSASISETNFIGANNFQYDFPKNTNPLPNNNNNNQESYTSLISTTNSSEFDTIIASDDDSERNVLEVDTNNDPKRKKKMEKRSLKAKIKDSIDAQMKRMMEKQEAWMEKMMRTIEENEKERISREEQWRKQDDERIRGEQKLWASEKAWIQARDAALMDAFGKLAGNGLRVSSQEELIVHDGVDDWEENVGPKMACFGQDDHMSDYLIKCSKKIKDNSRMIGVYHDHRTHESISDRQGIDRGNWPHDDQDVVNDNNCIRYFNGDAYGRIMN